MRYVSLMIVAVSVLAMVRQGMAEDIPVSNQSFETGNPPTDWSASGAFVREAASLGGLTGTATGTYVGQLNVDNYSSMYAYQNLSQEFVDGTTYTLVAAIGMRNDQVGSEWYAEAEDWTLSLNYADTGAEVAHLSGTILNDATHTGFLTDQTVQYVADATDAAHAIQIRIFGSTVGKLAGVPSGYGFGLLSVDNVRLDGTAVPEPSMVVLLVTGLIGLLAYAWRKRE